MAILPTYAGKPTKIDRRVRSRKWMITVWDQEDLEKIMGKEWQYIIVSALDQTEEEHNGVRRIHRHVFVQSTTNIPRLATKSAHWERANSVDGSIRYCRDKGEPLLESGSVQVCTRDKEDFAAFVDACKTQGRKELIEGPYAKLYARFRGFAAEVQATYNEQKDIDGETPNLWIWGSAGTGKSYYCRSNWPNAYLKMCNKWWDGYDNEDVVLIEDIGRDAGKVLTHHLKIWADRYQFLAESKGFVRKIRPKLVLVTSNYSPEDIWSEEADKDDLRAIRRRFNIVRIEHEGSFNTEALPIPFRRYNE